MWNTFFQRIVAFSSLIFVFFWSFEGSVYAILPYSVDGSFTSNITQTNQQWRVARNASITIRMWWNLNSFPALNNTSTQCFNQPGPTPAYPYGIFLDSSSLNISQCEAYNGTQIIRLSWAFIIDPFTAFTTKSTPTQIANAMVAKWFLNENGTSTKAFDITSAGGRDVVFTRTNTNDGNINYTNSIFDSSDAFQVINVVSGQSYRASLVQQAQFVPANVGSGEIYNMVIDGYPAYTYTAQAGNTVSDVTAGIVAAYNLSPLTNITCVDETTRVLCSGSVDTQAFSIDSYVTYPSPDTLTPQLTLLGSNPETITYGSVYTDPGATWLDNRDGTGTILATSWSVNTNLLGTYTLEYQKIDLAWNSGSITRTVNVVDTTAPSITVLWSDPLTIELDLAYSDSWATWTDDVDGSGTITLTGSELAKLSTLGTKTLNYVKTDTAGNTATGTRTVTVVDTIVPTISLTTIPVTIDANVYQISGRTSGGISVSLAGWASPVTVTPVWGAFSAFVPLTQNSTNTILVTATDLWGNIGTGVVLITESGSSSPFSSPVSVSGATLSGVTSFSGVSLSSTTRLVVEAPVVFTSASGGTSVIPSGTVITSTSGSVFDATLLNTLSVTVTGWLSSNQTPTGALEFGISGTGLYFSRPIKIQIPVPGYSGSTISVKVKHGGTSTYVTTGLSNDPNSTCTSGISSSPSAIATVSGGLATIYTCAASVFVGYTETSVASTSGWGGGGGSYVAIPTTSTGSMPTPTLPFSTTSSGVTSSGWVTTITTSLPHGTRVVVSVVNKRWKKSRIIVTRVKNGVVTFKTKKTGTFQIVKIGK